jgi:ATP-dependent helicase/nuclease subunit B
MHVFNVPASAPFLKTVVAALIDGELVEGFEARHAPERLADVTMYLPTRRAGRMVREIFLDALNTDAVILPRILALGDIDEDELIFADATAHDPIANLDMLPALSGLSRRLVLAQLIGAWAKTTTAANPGEAPLVISGPASTLALADDLARLMDDMATRDVPWDALNNLVPDNLDVYWQQTLKFLRIASHAWPDFLQEQNKIEPARRRDLLIEAEAVRLAAHHPGPIIAAGSTGSMPATARFLRMVASLPHGAVVLPGLDVDLDHHSWTLIGGVQSSADQTTLPAPSHPQFAMHALLARFGLTREDVKPLGHHAPYGRETLVSEAMRPANATAHWHQRLTDTNIAQRIADGMTHLAVVAAPTSDMEALTIATAMRETFETPDKTAALITPDRALARRVMAALARWNLDFDDSGGEAFMDTSAGLLARQIANVAAERFAPAPLLALLKHPLFRLGQSQDALAAPLENLELILLRGTRPPPGSAGLRHDFAFFCTERDKLTRGEASLLHRSEPRTQLDAAALAGVEDLLKQLQIIFASFETREADTPHDFAEIAQSHRKIIEDISRDEHDIVLAFEDADGLALARAFDDLAANGTKSGLSLTIADYPDVFQQAFGDRIVRRAQSSNARLRIYGPLEARLTTCDRVILGGLVEGVWPPEPRLDPWLSRPMRHQLGLDLPERRIGLSAHDFAQLLGAPEVIITHATKVGGAPAVMSRFLHRLEAVAGKDHWANAKERGEIYLTYAESLDRPEHVTPISQPQPRPPRHARPLKMSVTDIEHWLRDPYTIYAKHILALHALDPVDMPLSAADRGSAIHNALSEFTKTYRAQLPENPYQALCTIGAKHFAPLMDRPEARALWWPRFLRIAAWVADWEQTRRTGIADIAAEIYGQLLLPLDDKRSFTLSARADRIEHHSDGRYAILDYKTGYPPTGKQVRLGLSPQLTLEAAILRAGGFDTIPAGGSVGQLMYVRLSGNTPPGEEKPVELTRDKKTEPVIPPDEGADEARAKLEGLIRAFDNESQAYSSLNLSMWTNRYGDYDDLARIKEWSATGNGGDGA